MYHENCDIALKLERWCKSFNGVCVLLLPLLMMFLIPAAAPSWGTPAPPATHHHPLLIVLLLLFTVKPPPKKAPNFATAWVVRRKKMTMPACPVGFNPLCSKAFSGRWHWRLCHATLGMEDAPLSFRPLQTCVCAVSVGCLFTARAAHFSGL